MPSSLSGCSEADGTHSAKRPLRVIGIFVLCWATILFDGYDLLVYGVTLPELVRDPDWRLGAAQAGTIGSLALGGMLIGALTVGTVTDISGRRKAIIACQIAFSVFMGLAAFAPNAETFGACRFLSGLALGGVMPTAVALTLEYAAPKRRGFTYSVMYTGYSVGGILAAALAIPLVPAFGWRACYLVGALPLITLAPLSMVFLPESVAFLRAKGRDMEAAAIAERLGLLPETLAVQRPSERTHTDQGRLSSLGLLFRRDYLRTTLLLWATTFMGLLLVYGLATWIPEIMRKSGYELGPSLLTAVALNIGAIIGTIIGGHYGDRLGLRAILLVSFACAAVANVVLSLRPSFEINLIAIGVAGFGSIGTAILMNAFVASFYPTTSQATAVGWALGVGRVGGILGPIVGGLIAGMALPVSANFYVFGIAAVVGGGTLLLISRTPVSKGPGSPPDVDPRPIGSGQH